MATEDKWQRPEWICPSDLYVNFGIRDRCRHCGLPRAPEDDVAKMLDREKGLVYHPDPEIDAEVRAEVVTNRWWDWRHRTGAFANVCEPYARLEG